MVFHKTRLRMLKSVARIINIESTHLSLGKLITLRWIWVHALLEFSFDKISSFLKVLRFNMSRYKKYEKLTNPSNRSSRPTIQICDWSGPKVTNLNATLSIIIHLYLIMLFFCFQVSQFQNQTSQLFLALQKCQIPLPWLQIYEECFTWLQLLSSL